MHPYPAKLQSRFSRKQSLRWKIFILYFWLIFSCRITPFSLVPPVTEHPVYLHLYSSTQNVYFHSYISIISITIINDRSIEIARHIVVVWIVKFLKIKQSAAIRRGAIRKTACPAFSSWRSYRRRDFSNPVPLSAVHKSVVCCVSARTEKANNR